MRPCFTAAMVIRITTVDPNVGMHRLAQNRVRHSGIAVDQRVLSGEKLPFGSATFDYAVSTFTLYSCRRHATECRS